MTTFIKRASLATLVTIMASACGPYVPAPDVKVNPSPKERYEITLTLDEPPNVSRVEGGVDFSVEDKACMPVGDRIAGITYNTSFSRPFVLKRKNKNTYVGYIYIDWLLDENYYGLAICQWAMTSVQAFIHIGQVRQSAYIAPERVIDQTSQINLCRRPIDGYAWDYCTIPVDDLSVDADQSYVVTLTSRKMIR